MDREERNTGLDLLRILAAFSVIVLHTSAHVWNYLPILSRSWIYACACNIFTRFSVPAFVMISGALFLNPDHSINIKKLWLHSILRLFIIYIIWSSIYGLIECKNIGFSTLSHTEIIKKMIIGRYHLWFLPMIITIYMLTPILRTWTQKTSKKEIEYFLKLFIIFQILMTTISSLTKNPEILSFLAGFRVELACSYVGYFVLGYYLIQYPISDKFRTSLYIAFFPSFLINILVTCNYANEEQAIRPAFFDSYGLFTMLMTTAIFLLFTRKSKPSAIPTPPATNTTSDSFPSKIIAELSRSTFGVYLIHLLIMESPILLPILNSYNPYLSIPFVAIATFLAALAISALLRHIPFIGRYLC